MVLLGFVSCGGGGQFQEPSSPLIFHGHSSFGIASKIKAKSYCDDWKTIQEASERPAIAFLNGSFGDDYECVISAIVEREHVTVIYLTNEAGRRNGRLTAFDVYKNDTVDEYNRRLEHGDLSEIIEQINKLKQVFGPYENTGTFILIDGLESQFTEGARKRLLSVLRTHWPYEIGHNPVNNDCSKVDEDIWCDKHHYDQRKGRDKCILNGDGDLFPTRQEVIDWYKAGIGQCVMLTWEFRSQGLGGKPLFPHERELKFTQEDVLFYRDLHSGLFLE